MFSFGYQEKSGAAEGTRTPDPIITNDVLYQLSYSGVPARVGPILFSGAWHLGARMGRRYLPIPVCAPFPAVRRHRRLV